eukprot:TRINITY_DN1465_c1_g1_i3.p1 TRINITY_DN1465_c1_g1~~TRINITY_DN1465_c1_g1_i3.p1  ORF type:complete len:346 (-),score=75.60 TRINITY_DN1465_c1_g1_i3:92-1129(-)
MSNENNNNNNVDSISLLKQYFDVLSLNAIETQKGLLKEKEKLQKEKEEFEREKELFQKQRSNDNNNNGNIVSSGSSGSKIVRLNVGGQIFTTTMDTLTSCKGSYFDAMFSGRFALKREPDGTIFIDRDPTYFRHILNFLRGSLPPIDELRRDILVEIKNEADYYQLNDLVDLMVPPTPIPDITKWKEGPNYVISNNGKTATKTDDKALWSATTLAQKPIDVKKGGKYSWRVRIDTSNYYMVGIGSIELNQNIIDNYKRSIGWYLYTNCCTVYNRGVIITPYPNETPLHAGAIIGIMLDVDKRELSFSVDGTLKGVAVSDFPIDKFPNLTLSCCVAKIYDSVTILD